MAVFTLNSLYARFWTAAEWICFQMGFVTVVVVVSWPFGSQTVLYCTVLYCISGHLFCRCFFFKIRCAQVFFFTEQLWTLLPSDVLRQYFVQHTGQKRTLQIKLAMAKTIWWYHISEWMTIFFDGSWQSMLYVAVHVISGIIPSGCMFSNGWCMQHTSHTSQNCYVFSDKTIVLHLTSILSSFPSCFDLSPKISIMLFYFFLVWKTQERKHWHHSNFKTSIQFGN